MLISKIGAEAAQQYVEEDLIDEDLFLEEDELDEECHTEHDHEEEE